MNNDHRRMFSVLAEQHAEAVKGSKPIDFSRQKKVIPHTAVVATLSRSLQAPVIIAELITALWSLGKGLEYKPKPLNAISSSFTKLTPKRLVTCTTNFCTTIPDNYTAVIENRKDAMFVIRVGYSATLWLEVSWTSDGKVLVKLKVKKDALPDAELFEMLRLWKDRTEQCLMWFPHSDTISIHPEI